MKYLNRFDICLLLGMLLFSGMSSGNAIQNVKSFEELIASVQVQPQEDIETIDSERLQYCVSTNAVQLRKDQVTAKASIIDPGDKPSGKQSLRISLTRLDRDINDRKSLDNILITAGYNEKSAHFTKIMLAYLYGKYFERFPVEVQNAIRQQAEEYSNYFGRETENHIGMQRVSAAIFGAAFPDMPTPYGISGKELKEVGLKWIQDYGRAVYSAGMKEYLSPIYLGVHNEIWLTGAEHGPTDDSRKMSRAMLDWIWTDLAINSHLGAVMPPMMRAKTMLDRSAQASIPNTHAQWLAWLYWGNLHSSPGQDKLTSEAQSIYPGMMPNEMVDNVEGFQTAILPAASDLVPNEIIRNIGAKNVALPYMLLQSRPHGNYLSAVAENRYVKKKNLKEADVVRNHLRSAYVARNYSLSGGYFRDDNGNDNEQYKHLFESALVYRSRDHFNSIIVSHPYWYAGTPHGNEEEATDVFGLDCWLGKSPYEQMLHWENAIIYLYDIPDIDKSAAADAKAEDGKWISSRLEHPLKKVCFYVPESIDETRKTEWGWLFREGDVYIALRTVGSQGEQWESCSNPVQKGYKRLVTDGSLQALVVEMGDVGEYGNPENFVASIANTQIDLSEFKSRKRIRYVSTRGIPLDIRFNAEDWFPHASIHDVELDYENWPICESPYVSCRDRVLQVNDGKNGFTVDWSGSEPKYTNFVLPGN